MKWKQFMRNNGRASLWHLCDDVNETVCGWKYEPHEYTSITESAETPTFAVCASCLCTRGDAGDFRRSEEIKDHNTALTRPPGVWRSVSGVLVINF